MIAEPVELSQQPECSGKREEEREGFQMKVGGRTLCYSPVLLGKSKEILVAVIFTGRCHYDLWAAAAACVFASERKEGNSIKRTRLTTHQNVTASSV